jgi:hypothetical protein
MKKLNISTKQVATYEREYEVELSDEMIQIIQEKTIEEDWTIEDLFYFLQNEKLVSIDDCDENYEEEEESPYDGRYILSKTNSDIDDWLENIKDVARELAEREELV